MIEQQVNEIFLAADHNSILITHKCKIIAKRHNKILNIMDYPVFQNSFVKGIRVLNIDEIQKIFVFK